MLHNNSSPFPPPVLQEATKNSTSAWQENLEELFRNAKDRFPDVVWEVGGIDGDDMMKDVDMDVGGQAEEVWGHKAIVYARAPPSFQTRYFSFRQPITLPAGEFTDESDFIQPHASSPSPSPSPSTTTTAISQPPTQPPTTSLLRLTSSINSTLFSNELEYLYTGKGFGEAFEFLFDSSESSSRDRHLRGVDEDDDNDDADPEALRIDKLRKDLVFMWRSRLYSDVRIALTGNFSSSAPPGDMTTAIFSSHRFILVSRSPYFHNALSWNSSTKQQPGDEPPTLNLPSPPFTPASLHFTLGFMYTGTLIFSHRSYDLSTAFAILRAALYLSLDSLHDEIQARIVQEMLHGLYHAFIPFEEYERLTNGKWGTGGCRCRQCARRVPRVLEFALADDVLNRHLESGSRRALVGLFGEGWVHQEFASLPLKIRESILRGLGKRTRPLNVFPLLFAAEHGLGKLGVVIEPWGDISREMILSARKTIDDVLCKESEACFNSEEWMELMEADGVKFEDGEKVEWAMAAVLRGVKDPYAASLYQTLVSSILLRPHPTDVNAPLLPATSHVRVQVEQTRLELLKWIGKRWLGIRQERGFDALEGWALKEISDHIEVPIDDLLNPSPQSTKNHSPKRVMTTSSLLRPTSNHPHTSKVDTESDIASSMRVSVLSRSLPTRQTSTGTSTTSSTSSRGRESGGLSSSASSIRSVIRSSSDSFASAMSNSTVGAGGAMRSSNGGGAGMSPARMIVKETKANAMKDRPDSKLTPSVLTSPSILEPETLEEEDRMEEGEEEGEGEYDDDDESRNGGEQQQPTTPQQTNIKKVLITRASLASVTSRSTLSSLTGTGSSVSTRSVSTSSSPRSQSTAGKSSSVASSRLNVNTPSTPKSTISTRSSSSRPQRISMTGLISRPTSSLSSTTDSTATYRTASPGGGGGLHTSTRPRRMSGASTISIRNTPSRGGDKRNSPVSDRTRRISGASVSSVASNTGSVKATAASAVRARTMSAGKKSVGRVGGVTPPLLDPKKLSPASVPRPGSIHSSTSGGSTASNSSTSRRVVRKMVLKKKKSSEVEDLPPTPEVPAKELEVKEGTVAAETEKDTVKDNKEMDVDMDVVDVEKEAVVQEVNDGNPLPPVADDIIVKDPPLPNTSSTVTIESTSVDPVSDMETGGEHKKSGSSASTGSVATLKKKGSSDTIKTVTSSAPIVVVDVPLVKQLPPTPSPKIPSSPPPQHQQPPPPPPLQHQSSTLKSPTSVAGDLKAVPQGATLDIGIPCIIASRRKRFKAYARYIGEVQGESGAWVGVEVPMPFGDSWTSSSAVGVGDASSVAVAGDNKVHGGGDDRQWNDGTWGGIRYFEIGGMGGSEWDYGGSGGTNEDRASRRRFDGGGGSGRGDKGILKREGDQLSIASASEMRRKKLRSVSPAVSDMSGVESRGLFVRPQQVLYVVDAVGADL